MDVESVVDAEGQEDEVAACGRVGVALSEGLAGGKVLPVNPGGDWSLVVVGDGAGENGYGLGTHGLGEGGTIDVLGAVGTGIVGSGAVGGDFVAPVVVGGVEFFAYVDGL